MAASPKKRIPLLLAGLEALYTETARMVYDQLGKPVGDRIHALGLELTPVSPHRSLDGGSPPGYGGSASCPRWRWPGREGAWLEAWIGLCHRAWPSETLDDLVISLLLAIMTTERQHTLLTRFVPTTPSDAELDAKIDSILGDVDLVLPTAVALLTER